MAHCKGILGQNKHLDFSFCASALSSPSTSSTKLNYWSRGTRDTRSELEDIAFDCDRKFSNHEETLYAILPLSPAIKGYQRSRLLKPDIKDKVKPNISAPTSRPVDHWYCKCIICSTTIT